MSFTSSSQVTHPGTLTPGYMCYLVSPTRHSLNTKLYILYGLRVFLLGHYSKFIPFKLITLSRLVLFFSKS